VNRLIVLTVTALFCATVASVTTCASAWAQAGSIGGTIGKTDKSISGDAGSGQVSPSDKINRRAVEPGFAAESLIGRWKWTAHCSALWSGDLEISNASGSQFSGQFLSTGTGKLYAGQIRGTQVSFLRDYALGTQHWSGTLSRFGGATQIRGSLTQSDSASCGFEATKG
jgi:hypothetical protein